MFGKPKCSYASKRAIMASIYGKADIYDLIEDEKRYNTYKQHWEHILKTDL